MKHRLLFNFPTLGPALETGDYDVLLLDAWKTLFRGPYPEPPADTQEILGYKCRWTSEGPKVDVKDVDPEFLHVCLTTNIEDPYDFLVFLAQRFGLSRPTDDQQRKFHALIESEKMGLSVFADVARELPILQARGLRIGLLSNVWPFPIKHLLRETGLDRYFEHLILSYEVGHAKPSPEIFQAACQKFNTSAHRCLMVGDNPKLDIYGALAFGMPAVHIDRYPNQPSPERVDGVPVIGGLRELYRGYGD